MTRDEWREQHIVLLHRLRRKMDAYFVTPNERYLAEARSILVALHEHDKLWIGTTGRLADV